jgi:hypothetical protein
MVKCTHKDISAGMKNHTLGRFACCERGFRISRSVVIANTMRLLTCLWRVEKIIMYGS